MRAFFLQSKKIPPLAAGHLQIYQRECCCWTLDTVSPCCCVLPCAPPILSKHTPVGSAVRASQSSQQRVFSGPCVALLPSLLDVRPSPSWMILLGASATGQLAWTRE
ncbi:hypothetical protein VIGAN_03153600 [Vigna angularis var. angularis]|uniref:Uncharacterized protein n=1 Tax=Vigna angularis var. angularis TaxID=157739 RepID=A0A0S3RM80_PHAAN|nr:hypothetical protein VIGAN_03153600 [Vigna angularis var. angularis]